jgi:GTPase SAR1 family protein
VPSLTVSSSRWMSLCAVIDLGDNLVTLQIWDTAGQERFVCSGVSVCLYIGISLTMCVCVCVCVCVHIGMSCLCALVCLCLCSCLCLCVYLCLVWAWNDTPAMESEDVEMSAGSRGERKV